MIYNPNIIIDIHNEIEVAIGPPMKLKLVHSTNPYAIPT
jgi:hypothetical protein